MTPATPLHRLLAAECGLLPPRQPLLRWPPDAHLALALLVAVPVWAALAWALGPVLHRPASVGAWVAFVALWPPLEELVFRGLLQGQLLRLCSRGGKARRIGPVTQANALTTVAFVALHLGAQPLGWALAVAAPSLVLGHLRERFASVWPAVLVHMVYNAGFGAAAWVARYHPSLP